MKERKITLHIHPEADKHNTGLQQAIGYAAMWGDSDSVTIEVHKDGSVSASHFKGSTQSFYMEGFANHCVPTTVDPRTGAPITKYCFHS